MTFTSLASSTTTNLLMTGSTGKCPFLSKLPATFVRNYSGMLLKSFAQKCPVASKFMMVASATTTTTADSTKSTSSSSSALRRLTRTNHEKVGSPFCSSQVRTYSSIQQLTQNVADTDVLQASELVNNINHSSNKRLAPKRNNDDAEDNNHNGGQRYVSDMKGYYDVERRNSGNFDYDSFFEDKIRQKKLDHSYRVFKKLGRLANQFPQAHDYSSSNVTASSALLPWRTDSAISSSPQTITVWCSNDYLGMSRHPTVKRAVIDALEKYGAGSGGTRNIAGNSILHEELERLLAELHRKERALLFTSCYVANDTTLFTLARMLTGCHIFSDSGNHASMIQGIRNSLVPKHITKHNDPIDLERHLRTLDVKTPKIVAFETVHSMSGAICPLKQLCDVAHKYGALTFVDEVHAVGLYGKRGAGIGERNQCLPHMDMITGTLGKAFGSIGGYLAGPSNLIDAVRSYGSGFIFTTSLPPTVLAAALASVKILMSSEGVGLREKHQENVKYLRNSLMQKGIPVIHTPSHIIPISIGDPMIATKICDTLLTRYGHYLQAINYPTVPKGSERLRLAPTPFHTHEAMDTLVRDLLAVWNELGLPLKTPTCQFNCEYCLMPLKFEMFASRHEFMPCADIGCPKLSQIASDESFNKVSNPKKVNDCFEGA